MTNSPHNAVSPVSFPFPVDDLPTTFRLSVQPDHVQAFVLANGTKDDIRLLDEEWRKVRDAAWVAKDEGASSKTVDALLGVAARLRIRVDSLRGRVA